MGGGAEAVEAKVFAGARAGETIGAVADDASAEQRRGVFVGEGGRDGIAEIGGHDGRFGVAAVDVVAGEPGVRTEVFQSAAAEFADAAGGVKPGNADAVSFFMAGDTGSEGVNE